MTRRHSDNCWVAAPKDEGEEIFIAETVHPSARRKKRRKLQKTRVDTKGRVLMLCATTTVFSSLLLLKTVVANSYFRPPSSSSQSTPLSSDETLVILPQDQAEEPQTPQKPQTKASDRIIGGVNADVDRYPYAATLWDFQLQRCAGALVAADILLTAAHCAKKYTRVDLNRYNIFLPPNSLFDDAERYVFEEVVNHPLSRKDDEQSPQRYDFSLVKLWGRSTAVEPVAIAGIGNNVVNYTVGEPLTVIGWGYTTSESNPPQQRSNVLREVELYYVGNEECSNADAGPPLNYTFQGRIFPEMLCASAPDRDSCNGDSGGPILVTKERRMEQAALNNSSDQSSLVPLTVDILVGSVSFGAQCASDIFPGVYSRVAVVADWIRETVCSMTSYQAPSWFQCPNPPPPLPPPPDQLTSAVTIELQLDLDSDQSGWVLRSVETGTVYGYKPILSYTNNGGETLIYETVPLPAPNSSDPEEYEFVLLDSGGDGVCCDWADGYFKIYQGVVADPLTALQTPVLVNETRGEWPRFPIGDLGEELYTTHVSVTFSLVPEVEPSPAPSLTTTTAFPTTTAPTTNRPTVSKSPVVLENEVPSAGPTQMLLSMMIPTRSPSPTVWFPTGSTPPTVSVPPGPKTGGSNSSACVDHDDVIFRIYVPNHRNKKRNCKWLSERNHKKVAYYCDTIRKARGFCRGTCGFDCLKPKDGDKKEHRRFCTDMTIRGAVFPWHVRTDGSCEWLRQQRPTKRVKYCAQKAEYFSNAFDIPAKVCPNTCRTCDAVGGDNASD